MSMLKWGLLMLVLLGAVTLFLAELTSLKEEIERLKEQLREHEGREVTDAKAPAAGASPALPRASAPKVDEATLGAKNFAVLQELRKAYQTFGADLLRARKSVSRWSTSVDLYGGTDDVDAEIIYMKLRTIRAKRVAELGFGQGLMTTWLLHALQDNGADTHLFTHDLQDQHLRAVEVNGTSPLAPDGTFERAQGRWHFVYGDATKMLPLNEPYDYIHSDAAHTVPFAKWVTEYCRTRFPTTPSSFHDVWKPFTKEAKRLCPKSMHMNKEGITPEGRVFLQHATAIDPDHWFGFAPWHFPEFNAALMAVRQEVLGLKGVGATLGDEGAWIANGRSPKPPRQQSRTCRAGPPQSPTIFVNHFA